MGLVQRWAALSGDVATEPDDVLLNTRQALKDHLEARHCEISRSEMLKHFTVLGVMEWASETDPDSILGQYQQCLLGILSES